jgi:hypothetical protein
MNTIINNTTVCHFLDDVVLHLYNITYNPLDTSNECETLDEYLTEKIKFIKNKYPDIISKFTIKDIYNITYNNEDCLMQDYIFNGRLTDILINELGIRC